MSINARGCAAIGFTMAAAILLFGPYTNYSPPAVDGWFPTGYFTNFDDMIERFGLDYHYVTRLPYILPGAALYAVFTPKAANLLLNLASFGTIVTCLLVMASRRLDRRWAIALTTLFAFNSYLLFANLWDYSDGPAIAYFLAGLAIVTASECKSSPPIATLIAVGACWMCAVLTNLLACALILTFGLHLVFSRSANWHEPFRRTLWLSAGAILAFLPLMAVSRFLFGVWFFPVVQILQLLRSAESADLLPNMWGWGHGWTVSAYRLAALYGPMLVAIACLFSRKYRTPDFIATLAICASGGLFFLAAELADKVLLRAVNHGSFLLVFSFTQTVALVQAATTQPASAADRRVGPRLMVVLAVAAGFLFAHIPNLGGATWFALGFGAVLFATMVLVSRDVALRTCGTAVATALLLNVSTASDTEVRWIYQDNKGRYVAALEAQSLLTSGIVRGEKIRFWHDRDDPQSSLFLAINALYLWLYKDLTTDLPTMGEAEMREFLPPGVTLIHLCSHACPLEPRTGLLRAAHIDVLSTYIWEVRPAGAQPFTIAVQKTRPAEIVQEPMTTAR